MKGTTDVCDGSSCEMKVQEKRHLHPALQNNLLKHKGRPVFNVLAFCKKSFLRLFFWTSLGLCLSHSVHAQLRAQAEFSGASVSGYDWICGSVGGNYSSISDAINALVAYTHSCQFLVSIHTDTCSAVDRNTRTSGSCSYAGKKNDEGGGDNVGGAASWTFSCPAGTTSTEGGQCSCPGTQTWDASNRVCLLCAPGNRWSGTQCTAIAEEDRPQHPSSCPEAVGNPIFPTRGNKRETVPFSIVAGWIPFQLTYDSTTKLPTTTPVEGKSLNPQPPSFGDLWLSNLHRQLLVDKGQVAARVSRGDGRVISFAGNGLGAFTPPPSITDRLLSVSGGYLYFDASAQLIETYDLSGNLQRIDHAAGQSMSFTYSNAATPAATAPGPNYLLTVTDSFGRSFGFKYNEMGFIKEVTDPAGEVITVAYTERNLTQLTWQDKKIRGFLYENAAFAWALTGVVDERNLRKSTFGYDSAGRAISTEHAGGVNKYSITYGTPPAVVVTDTYDATTDMFLRVRSWQPPVAPQLTTPFGTVVNLGVSISANNPVVTTRSQPAGSGCAASSSSMTHDIHGNVDVEDDFNGVRQCRVHDLARNLATIHVQGLATTQACSAVVAAGASLPTPSRKITTQWHPDWPLEVKVAEPGRITTYIYNGQPDPFNGNTIATCAPSTALLPNQKPIVVLCKQVQQATTDGNGRRGFGAVLQAGVANRVERWTYNQLGQVLTASDPVNNTTAYAYHAATTTAVTRGDLASMTDAKGHITQYTNYNKHGQLLRSVDANGVISTYTYDLRQRLTSANIGGAITSSAYDAAGQLTRMTMADGSWVGFEYDNAQRQVAVLDSRGNRIDYTLDNAGRRTSEVLRDPSGSLVRLLERSIDALGRVQQTTGLGARP